MIAKRKTTVFMVQMSQRQAALLKELLEKYVSSAVPVASSELAKKLKVSSATIRHELAALEELGYLEQPHPSAGRVPTLAAYRYYVQSCTEPQAKHQRADQALQSALATDQPLKQLVKLLSVEIHGCVGFAQGSQDFYYTGLSELFAQPEFRDQQYLLDVSRLIDTFDGILAALPRQSVKRSAVLLGEENSLPVACALFVAPWEYQGESGVFACLTPLRADYNYILGLLDSVIDTLDSHS